MRRRGVGQDREDLPRHPRERSLPLLPQGRHHPGVAADQPPCQRADPRAPGRDTVPVRAPLAKPAVHSCARAINTLLTWAAREGEEVTAEAQRPRLDRLILEVLSRKEIGAMEERPGSERDKLIVQILGNSRRARPLGRPATAPILARAEA